MATIHGSSVPRIRLLGGGAPATLPIATMLAVEKLAQGLIARTVAAATGIRREMEIMVLDRAPTFPPKALLSPAGRPDGEGVRRRAHVVVFV